MPRRSIEGWGGTESKGRARPLGAPRQPTFSGPVGREPRLAERSAGFSVCFPDNRQMRPIGTRTADSTDAGRPFRPHPLWTGRSMVSVPGLGSHFTPQSRIPCDRHPETLVVAGFGSGGRRKIRAWRRRAYRQLGKMKRHPMNDTQATQLVPVEHVERMIHFARGEKVLLDDDLSVLYGVTTGALNRAVKRNPGRFPPTSCSNLRRRKPES